MIQSLLACPDTIIDLVLNPGWNEDYDDFDVRQRAVEQLRELLESEQLILYVPPVVISAIHLIVGLRFGKYEAHDVVTQTLRLGNSNLKIDHERALEQASTLLLEQTGVELELYEAAILTYASALKADAVLVRHAHQRQQLVDFKQRELPEFNTHILRAETLISYIFEYQFQDIPDGQWIHVLTPNNTLVRLPYGATPIDFAYKIHTAVGSQCIGAKVDGSPAPLNRPLQDYEVVEIIRGATAKPNPEWLKFAATKYARKAIHRDLKRYWGKKGWKAIKRAFGGNVRAYKQRLECVAKNQNRTLDELTVKVGAGVLDLRYLKRLIDECDFQQVGKAVVCADPQDCPAIIAADANWRLASCCIPLPGDPISGVIGSHDQAIRVHRIDCPNLAQVKPERLCDLSWNCGYCSIQLLIVMSDQPDTFRPILDMLAEILADSPHKPDLRGVHISNDGSARTSIKLSTSSRRHLDGIINQIKSMPGVLKVKVTKLIPLPEN